MKYFKHPQALVHKKAKIGAHSRIWAFANIQEGVRVGMHCNIADHCFLEKGVRIGNHVTIKNGVALFQGVCLEDDVFCGTQVVFVNDRRPRSHRQDAWTLENTLVKKGATIGSNATILCGLTIGSYAMIGAGSVVTKDVPAFALVAGNPARVTGWACQCGRKLHPALSCDCGLTYELSKEGLRPHA